MKKSELEERVRRLEAVLRTVPPLRNEAMIRSGDSPMASRAIDAYDAAFFALDSLPRDRHVGPCGSGNVEDRPTCVYLKDGTKVVIRGDRDGYGVYLEIVPQAVIRPA